jgi:hypothetical protein
MSHPSHHAMAWRLDFFKDMIAVAGQSGAAKSNKCSTSSGDGTG